MAQSSVVGGSGREDFRRYWESSVDVPGPAVEELGRTARENNVYLVIGVVEREGGTLYCTVLFFAPNGRWLGKHRKIMPTGSERLVWGFGDGSTLPVFDTPLGKIGAVICWENYLPLMRAAMYAAGELAFSHAVRSCQARLGCPRRPAYRCRGPLLRAGVQSIQSEA